MAVRTKALMRCVFILGLGTVITLTGAPARLTEAQVSQNCPLESRFVENGFVNVQSLDPSIMVDLKYARQDNFMGEKVYVDLKCAWLRPKAAEMLVETSRILRERHPNLRILVADALRPRSVQQKMWKGVVNTERQRYVANPSTGSMHNYGTAVDVTLYDVITRRPLDMGTPLDHFGPLAQPALESHYLRLGELNESQLSNRMILREAMREAGWYPLRIEWWHFDAFPVDEVRRRYSIIE